ncbi:MAG: hypothetical protein H7X89_10255 [Rhizobiales bacterium]|nr:hypothetical protein [Hyphomicrobiales bacterium]
MSDGIEFRLGDRMLLAMETSHAPDRGDLVNIRKTDYRVIGRTYAVDDANDPRLREMVCIVKLAEVGDDESAQNPP